MRKRGLFISIGLLLFVNAVVLGGVVYNRSGESDAAMTMTERELPLTSGYGFQENSGVSLRINSSHAFYWGRKASNYDDFVWLDMKKLESLGFRFGKHVNNEEKNDYYDRQMPRQTFAVLEFDGAAWDAWKKKLEEELVSLDQEEKEEKKTDQELKTARDSTMRELRTGSRLFIIDAGNDPAFLRMQYTDRSHYIIIPATVRVSYYGSYASPGASKSSIRGYITLLIDEINVPNNLHKQFDKRQPQNTVSTEPPFVYESGLHYDVSLRTGKRYEPWIVDIVRTPAQ